MLKLFKCSLFSLPVRSECKRWFFERYSHLCVGKYSLGNNAGGCAPHSSCPSGMRVNRAGTSTSDTVCASLCSGSEPLLFVLIVRLIAAADQYWSGSSCRTKQTCSPGSYISNDGGSESDRSCHSCPSGVRYLFALEHL